MTDVDNHNGNSNQNEYENENISEPEHVRKLFIGGLDYRTTDESLKSYFEQWGNIVDVVVMKDPKTKRSRGFGFITYSQSFMIDNAQKARPHKIDGRVVEPKRAVPRQEIDSPNAGASVKKLFVGGLRDDHDEESLRQYFSEFGNIDTINFVTDKDTGKKRGFAFIEFDDYDAVDKIVLRKNHSINNKVLDVKKAIAKRDMNRMQTQGNNFGRNNAPSGGRGGMDNSFNRNSGRQNNWGGDGGNNRGQTGGWNSNDNFDNNGGGGGNNWNNQPSWNNNSKDNDYWSRNGSNYSYNGNDSGANQNSWGGNGGFGDDYQQNYSGGPVRNNYGNNRSVPYNQGGGANNNFNRPQNVSAGAGNQRGNGSGGFSGNFVPPGNNNANNRRY